jgi:hypothetical protein
VTFSHAEAQLRKRNEKLDELWELDKYIRTWHGRHPDESDDDEDLGDMMEDRFLICMTLTRMGCNPWDFCLECDNSWLAKNPKASNGSK